MTQQHRATETQRIQRIDFVMGILCNSEMWKQGDCEAKRIVIYKLSAVIDVHKRLEVI